MRRVKGSKSNKPSIQHRTTGISKAIWPADTQRWIATNKAAQGRRLIIIKGSWWSTILGSRMSQFLYKGASGLTSHLRQHLLIVLLTLSIFLVGFITSRWSVVFTLILLSLLTSTVLYYLLHTHTNPNTVIEALPKQDKESSEATLNFPETPVPATPLIRVLETIDLSSSDVEHFIPLPSEDQSHPEVSRENQSSNITVNE